MKFKGLILKFFDNTANNHIAGPDKIYSLISENFKNSLAHAAGSMVLSASGWRKVFAENDESSYGELKSADIALVALAALSFADFLKSLSIKGTICLGTDTRPTGPQIADIFIRILFSEGLSVRYLRVVSAPEIMAYVKCSPELDAFVYVSASHNPIGHNGFKFGLAEGSVIGGDLSSALISIFNKKLTNSPPPVEIGSRLKLNPGLENIFENCGRYKQQSYKIYHDFVLKTASGIPGEESAENFLSGIKAASRKRKIGIVVDFNGSARCVSPDLALLKEAGLNAAAINDTPGKIEHRIVPEGESLLPCARFLENCRKQDGSFMFGYVPDNDGDRGNIVYFSETQGKAIPMEAQQVFAIAVLAELLFLADSSVGKKAIVVNGPTSNRINRIAEALGAEVFRVEVGEANVVNKAKQLIDKGYCVRIIGEGSNGGNITLPATVRDPMNTVFSILKFFLSRPPQGYADYFQYWLQICGREDLYKANFTLDDILACMPAYITTSAYEPEAILTVRSEHRTLKRNYESIFLAEWEKKKKSLKDDFNIYSYQIINYERTDTKTGLNGWTGKATGGYKILFYDEKNIDLAFIWMRGSGTEPVFRILADVRGNNPDLEKKLLIWHTDMVLRADKEGL